MLTKIKYLFLLAGCTLSVAAFSQDYVADNMLVYQRSVGGWPKHIGEIKIDYTKKLSPAEKAGILDDVGRNDATIDNEATSKEIRYLVTAYKKYQNKDYLNAAEKGIRYLLKMQHANGGFPQFYPDSSLYRSQVTFNDNAMVNALNILWDVIYRTNGFDAVDPSLVEPSKTAVAKGIDCILKTQIVVDGKLTAWCTQYDKKTLKPAKARSFELPSIASLESVGILEFLMKIGQPGSQIKNAINSGVQWLERSKITGYDYVDIKDSTQPNGRDRVLLPDNNGVVWARFYDIETNRPMFAGRDGVKKWSVTEIENERRTGYGWYGTWPKKLLDKEYPAWLKKNSEKVTGAIKIIVDKTGKGNFTSIQSALNSLADSAAEPRTILIKNGIYKEKIFITKHNIILQGEDRDKTILSFDIARDEWRCDHKDDWGVATMNLAANDITLKDLTIANDYGFNYKEPRTIDCASDSVSVKKIITNAGHQMALRTRDNTTTRLKAINCRFRAYAGDTVSPWNLKDGMFYFKDCVMEGGVDFYCPRGSAYAEGCHFFANTGPASIWHDGSGNPDFKTVLINCSFDGFAGFNLGRYHKDAQFYLVNCTFSKNMADKDIYLVPTTNVIQYGRRVYYFNCHREGGDYAWHKNNLNTAANAPDPNDINADWVFKGKWHSVDLPTMLKYKMSL
jgi:pectinesterase